MITSEVTQLLKKMDTSKFALANLNSVHAMVPLNKGHYGAFVLYLDAIYYILFVGGPVIQGSAVCTYIYITKEFGWGKMATPVDSTQCHTHR